VPSLVGIHGTLKELLVCTASGILFIKPSFRNRFNNLETLETWNGNRASPWLRGSTRLGIGVYRLGKLLDGEVVKHRSLDLLQKLEIFKQSHQPFIIFVENTVRDYQG
jgi:hypothetical protein